MTYRQHVKDDSTPEHLLEMHSCEDRCELEVRDGESLREHHAELHDVAGEQDQSGAAVAAAEKERDEALVQSAGFAHDLTVMKIARDDAEQEASSLRQALREYDEAAVEVLNVCAKGTAGSGTPQSAAFGKLDTAWLRARPLLKNGVARSAWPSYAAEGRRG